ncbi:MAG TPA: hypothetical protein VM662_02160 [Sphingomonas sp.]|nr:hypothetical protein [Sphingomonas sp.]
MAKNLTAARDAEARSIDSAQAEPWLIAAEWREPLAERMIQAGSRLAGVVAFFAALGATGYWLLG